MRRLVVTFLAAVPAVLCAVGDVRSAPPPLTPHSTIYVALCDPGTEPLRAEMRQWYSLASSYLSENLSNVKSMWPLTGGAVIQPEETKFEQAAAPDEDRIAKNHNAHEIIVSRANAFGGRTQLVSEIYLGGVLDGPLARGRIHFRFNLDTNTIDQIDADLLYVSYYAIAMDAQRMGDKPAACRLLRAAQRKGKELGADATFQSVEPAVEQSLGILLCNS